MSQQQSLPKSKPSSQPFSTLSPHPDARTFVFQREQTHQSLIIDITIPPNTPFVDLSALFSQYCPLAENKVSVYDPESNRFVALAKIGAQESGLLPACLLEARVVMIRFRKLQPQKENSQSDSGVESGLQSGRENKQKKDRSKERTIGESIDLVKKWRMIHLESLKSGLKKMSLADAAKSIGVSKKTLDDYYYQLRLGEFYSFDFASSLNQKIGILRCYVKAFKPERQEKNKNVRHPRNLRIIEQFESELPGFMKIEAVQPPSPIIEETLKSEQSLRSFSLQEDSLSSISSPCNPFLHDVIDSYEDKFFKNFEFLLDDPNDPFIEADRNFKKKNYEEPNNDFFFF